MNNSEDTDQSQGDFEDYEEIVESYQYADFESVESIELSEMSGSQEAGTSAMFEEQDDNIYIDLEDEDLSVDIVEEKKNLKRKEMSSPGDESPKSKRTKNEQETLDGQTMDLCEDLSIEIVLDSVFDVTDESMLEEFELEIEYAPLPPKGCNIFADIQFIVMKTPPAPNAKDKSAELENNHPFSKARLTEQINAGNGFVFKTIKDINWLVISKRQKESKIFLVTDSNTPITKTFLRSAVVDVPCVKPDWINECCRAGLLIDHKDYLHPIGTTLLSQSVVDWHKCRKVFKNVTVAVKTNDIFSPEFDFWRDIISFAGGTVVDIEKVSEFTGGKGVALLIDRIYPTFEVRELKSQLVPMVNTDWVIESIIVGHKVNWRRSNKFTWGKGIGFEQ